MLQLRGEGREDQLQQAARFLGLDLARPRVVAVLWRWRRPGRRLRGFGAPAGKPERDERWPSTAWTR